MRSPCTKTIWRFQGIETSNVSPPRAANSEMDVDAAGPSDLPVSWDRRGANHGRNDWRSALMRRPEGSAGRSEQVLFSRACGSRSRRRLRARLRRDSIQAVRDEGDDRLAQIETGVSEPRHRPVAVQFAEWHPPIRAAFSVEGKYDRGVPVRRNVGEPVVEGRLSTKAEPVRASSASRRRCSPSSETPLSRSRCELAPLHRNG